MGHDDRRFYLTMFQPCFTTKLEFRVRLRDDVQNELGTFVTHAIERDGHHILFGERGLPYESGVDGKYGKPVLGIAHSVPEAIQKMYDFCKEEAKRLIRESIKRGEENIRWFVPGDNGVYARQDARGTEEDPAIYYADSLEHVVNQQLQPSNS